MCECGASLAVRELERHKKAVCTRTEVSCPHEKLGCGARLLRTEMSTHLEACDYQRLRPAFLELEARHAAEVAKLKQDYELTLAGERAYFEQELGRLRAQLQLANVLGGRADQRGEPKVRLSKGGFARKAKALGLATAEELQLAAAQPQKGKRKRGPKAAGNKGGPPCRGGGRVRRGPLERGVGSAGKWRGGGSPRGARECGAVCAVASGQSLPVRPTPGGCKRV